MKRALSKLLTLCMCTTMLTSVTGFAEETTQDSTELATMYLTQAYQSLAPSDVTLAETYVSTTTSPALTVALTDIKQILQDKERIATLQGDDVVTELVLWNSSLLAKASNNAFLQATIVDSSPVFLTYMAVPVYEEKYSQTLQAYYDTLDQAALTTATNALSAIELSASKAAIVTRLNEYVNLRVQADNLVLQAESRLVSVEQARGLVNQLPDGLVKVSLLTRLLTVEGDTSTLQQLTDSIRGGYKAFTLNESEIEAQINRMPDKTLPTSYLNQYKATKAKLAELQTSLQQDSIFTIQLADQQFKSSIDSTAFLEAIDKLDAKAYLDSIYVSKLAELLTSYKNTNAYNTLQMYEGVTQLITNTATKNTQTALLATYTTLREEAEMKVSAAESDKKESTIDTARSYVLANLTHGVYRDSLLTRLNAITSSGSSDKSLRELERDIDDAVKDKSVSKFKSAVKAYVRHKDSNPSDEYEAYVAVYDDNKDTTIRAMFDLIDDIKDYKSKSTSELEDRIEKALEDMPRKARDWFEDDYKGRTNSSSDNTNVTVRRSDLSTSGRDMYDTLDKYLSKVSSNGAKDEISKLINTLKYDMSVTELNDIAKKFNRIVAKEISNKGVRNFFEYLYS